jgi:hypothetical protein
MSQSRVDDILGFVGLLTFAACLMLAGWMVYGG